MGRTKTITEADLLEAAMRVIVRDGLPKLTLDATAKEAGVSKGGVLYNFATKDDLLRALIRRCVDMMDQEIARHSAADPVAQGRWLRAYLAAATDPAQRAPMGGGDLQQLHTAMIAAVAMNPELLSSVHDYVDRWNQKLMEDGVDPIEHAITMMAIDGLTFNRLLGCALPATVVDSLVGRLRERTLPLQKDSS